MAKTYRQLVLVSVLLFLGTFPVRECNTKTIQDYEGTWHINREATEALKEPYKENSRRRNSRFNTQMSLGGLPMPRSGGQRPMSQLIAQNPMVLRCSEMSIKFETPNEIRIVYEDLGQEILRRGDYRGRKTKWSIRGIKQAYNTTERRVTKNWSINKKGQLLVEVKIKPKESKQFITRAVFDRKSV